MLFLQLGVIPGDRDLVTADTPASAGGKFSLNSLDIGRLY